MGRDEQIEEREVLDSIFLDEIIDISDSSYRVSIALDVTSRNGDDIEPPVLLLTVTYPPTYPDEPPVLDISAPPNAPKYPYLAIQDDKATLLASLHEPISENIGMAMIFTLVSTLKDTAELLISERQNAAQAIVEGEKRKEEEAEDAKFHGEKVTKERFLEWRERFRTEQEELEEEKRKLEEEGEKKKKGKGEERMTGRELWERGLVGRVVEDEDNDDGIDALERLRIQVVQDIK